MKLKNFTFPIAEATSLKNAAYFTSRWQLSYSELEEIIQAVCMLLLDAKAFKEIVCVHLDQETEETLLYIPVICAILRRDCAFYFIRDRRQISEELQKCGARLIITSCKESEKEGFNYNTRFGILELSISSDGHTSSLPEDTCYLISTSGTSGTSKLVHVTNGSAVPNILDIRKEFKVTAQDLVLLCSPLTFDPHIIELFISLSAGATILMMPRCSFSKGTTVNENLFTQASEFECRFLNINFSILDIYFSMQ